MDLLHRRTIERTMTTLLLLLTYAKVLDVKCAGSRVLLHLLVLHHHLPLLLPGTHLLQTTATQID
jgi:hypothetical protein